MSRGSLLFRISVIRAWLCQHPAMSLTPSNRTMGGFLCTARIFSRRVLVLPVRLVGLLSVVHCYVRLWKSALWNSQHCEWFFCCQGLLWVEKFEGKQEETVRPYLGQGQTRAEEDIRPCYLIVIYNYGGFPCKTTCQRLVTCFCGFMRGVEWNRCTSLASIASV